MKKREFLKTGGAVAAAMSFPLTVQAQGATYNWKMATGWSGGPLMDLGAKAFAEKMEQFSGGRFKIQTFPGGALGNALKVPETVKNGVAELGHTWMGYDWGKDPTTVLFGGYAGSFDSERMLHWLYVAGGTEMQRKFREQTDDVISMPLFIRTAEAFLHSRKPVRTLNDLKGLKLRTAGAWLEMAKDLGAAPVTTAGGDVYPMLERGAIDATEWGTLYENIPMGFHKVAKYIIYPGVHQPTAPFELVINKAAWAKLSEADKKLVDMVAKLVTLESWLKVGQEDAKALDFYRKSGNTVIELSPEVQYAARKIGLDWATKTAKENKYPFFAPVFDSQQALDKLWEGASGWRSVKTKAVSSK
ncbi:TRAP transporter substrate-binding protein DctP [Polynucleobacter sp. HIN5]|uniref:TRAP transporter substrate-binding protein DctP n=1 Tax=Polynucleobacter sp. HIN5 TaxID=3047864 RepID=UPI0025745809|nr:TRAP transporter substrate-binding protein DctP [Polynucleobacter sp. HIN5]BEI33029.1 TRAP transporter substrate-binding protein [Polynucleobacter sp. HIN5]